ncbi:MAG TPA: M28 family peptidase [Gemmatimonadaceae bacterium]|nr:M28 family peptidase [Gemmatimonadaceae bacterium]
MRAAADAISTDQLSRDIGYLASDALRGRFTFSPGLDSAAQFIVRRLRTAGLEPRGDDGTYFQHFVVQRGSADTAAAFMKVGARRFGFGQFLLFPFNRAIDTTAPVVFVGSGGRIPSMNIDAYAGVDVRGKFALAELAAPPRAALETHAPDIEGPRIAAEKLGAVATLLIATRPMLDAWAEMQTSPAYWSYAELESPMPTAAPRLGTTIVLEPALVRALLSPDSAMADRILNRPPGADFPPAFELQQQATVHIPATQTRDTSYNIIAVIEGADPRLRHEYVTIAAHLDGKFGPPVPGDSIFNAADDNASGSAGILAVAEHMMRAPRPRRSVMFIWDTGHEIGLFGSRAFVGKRIVPLQNIVAHFNVDMIGSTAGPLDSIQRPDFGGLRIPAQPHEVFVVGPRVLSSGLDSLVERTNRAYLGMRLNHTYDTPDAEFFFPRTDAAPFIVHGVPVIEFFTGLEWRYHRSNDEARYLDMNKVRDVSRTLMATVWQLANAPTRPALDKGFPSRVPRLP